MHNKQAIWCLPEPINNNAINALIGATMAQIPIFQLKLQAILKKDFGSKSLLEAKSFFWDGL